MDALYFLLKELCYKPGIYLLAYNVNKKSRFHVAFKRDPKVKLIETVNMDYFMDFLQSQPYQEVFQKSNKVPQRVVTFWLTQVYLVIP